MMLGPLVVLAAVGALLPRLAVAQTSAPTYAGEIAGILDTRCAPCHRAGGLAPFSLLTYDDARRRAPQIADVTARRYMPPWKPDPGSGPFEGEQQRRLSDGEIDLLQRWAAAGAPEGDPSRRPAPPVLSDSWPLGPPDLIVRMPDAYAMPADGRDVYRTFAIRPAIDEPRYVKAVDLRPGVASVVHHARIMLDRTGTSREIDREDPLPGYDGMLVDRARFPDGHFLGWAPGKSPTLAPEGLAWRLDPNADLVLQLHMIPTGRPETVQAEVGLYFSPMPPTRTPVLVLLTSKTIDIPAGVAAHIVEDRYQLPVDVELLAIYPHAHYLARTIESIALFPDGIERPLIAIADWDFNWQDDYRYTTPMHLPAGTTVVMRYTYDNSGANVRNPHDPPQRVRFGPRSTDEMAELMLQVLPTDPATHARLLDDVDKKLRHDAIAGLEARLAINADDQYGHLELAVRYLESNEVDRAITHLEEALRIDPDFATAYYNLGSAMTSKGRREDAIAHYRRAIELKPDYTLAHNNLGAMLQATGNLDEAVLHYRLALQFDPRHSGAHYNLGNVLFAQGQPLAAIDHFQRALAVTPDDAASHNSLGQALAALGRRQEAATHYQTALDLEPALLPAMNNLAWVLATSPETDLRDPSRALALARRAATITEHRHPAILDTLAAAYAANGMFDQAIETARSAVDLAEKAGAPRAAAEMRRRLQVYLQYKPFRVGS